MEKLIKLDNEYYLLNDEQVKYGDKAMDKNNHVQTYTRREDYDRNFTKVIASTDAFHNLPMLNKTQIELLLCENEDKEFSIKDLELAIKLTWAHQQIRLTADPKLGDNVDELTNQIVPIIRTKTLKFRWDEVESEGKNEQGYIIIKSIK